MMTELDELYQQVIIDHTRKPRNFHELSEASCHAEGFNPLCGDRVTVYVNLDNGTIADVAFTGSGCAICTSSASLMTESLKGKSREEAKRIFENVHELLTGNLDEDEAMSVLGKLAVFSGVRKFPIRVKCATLPWHTLNAALDKRADVVSTE